MNLTVKTMKNTKRERYIHQVGFNPHWRGTLGDGRARDRGKARWGTLGGMGENWGEEAVATREGEARAAGAPTRLLCHQTTKK